MADRYPLIVDNVTNTVKEIPSGDNLNLSGSGIINVSNLTVTGIATINTELDVGVGATTFTAVPSVGAGIGTATPYAVGSDYRVLNVGASGAFIGGMSTAQGPSVTYNSYWNGYNWVRAFDGTTSHIQFDGDQGIRVAINPSGPAGSFTPIERVVISPSGVVGVGSTIPRPGIVLDVGPPAGFSSFRTHVQLDDDIYFAGGGDGIMGIFYQALPGVAGRTAAYQAAGGMSNCGIGTFFRIHAPGLYSSAAVECLNNRINIRGGLSLLSPAAPFDTIIPAGTPYEYGDIATAGGSDGVFVISNTALSGTQLFAVRNAGGTYSFPLSMSSAGVTVTGALSKSSGSFRIPHPVAEGKDLVHSFIEGPRADLIYRGTVTLSGGTATVNLDEEYGLTAGTWNALCRNPQVWVTSDTGWTLCKGSVTEGVLTIEAQTSTCTETVSWLVVAERKDVHMYDTEWTDENGRPILEPNTIVTEVNTAE